MISTTAEPKDRFSKRGETLLAFLVAAASASLAPSDDKGGGRAEHELFVQTDFHAGVLSGRQGQLILRGRFAAIIIHPQFGSKPPSAQQRGVR